MDLWEGIQYVGSALLLRACARSKMVAMMRAIVTAGSDLVRIRVRLRVRVRVRLRLRLRVRVRVRVRVRHRYVTLPGVRRL